MLQAKSNMNKNKNKKNWLTGNFSYPFYGTPHVNTRITIFLITDIWTKVMKLKQNLFWNVKFHLMIQSLDYLDSHPYAEFTAILL